MARPKKPRNYHSTVSDILDERDRKEKERRENISQGMKAYRETERLLRDACMSTEEMRVLHQYEEQLWQLFLANN